MSETSQRIKMIVVSSNLSNYEFASTIGITPSNLYKMLRGEVTPSFEAAQKILAAFPNVNARWLLTGEGDMLELPHAQA